MGRKLTLAIDLGCYELKGIVFEIVELKNNIHVLAAKKEKTMGIEDGKIIHPDLLKEKMRSMIESLNDEVDDYIEEVYITIPPSNTYQNTMMKQTVVANSSGTGKITSEHVYDLTERILNDIKAKSENNQETLIDFLINEYSLSHSRSQAKNVKKEIVESPVGMYSHSFGIEVFFVIAKSYVITTLQTILDELDVYCEKITVPFVPGLFKAVPYTPKKEGALYIDIGARFTNAVIFRNNSIVYHNSFPVAGNEITSDLIRAFGKTPNAKEFLLAEKIKKKYGNLTLEAEDSQKNVYIDTDLLSDAFLTLEQVKLIMRERVKEIFSFIKEDIEKRAHMTDGGIEFQQIFMAGGTAKLQGIEEVAREVFGFPASVSTPFIDSGVDFDEIDSPEFVTVYGLAEYFARDVKKPVLNSGILNKLKGKLKTIFNKKKGGE